MPPKKQPEPRRYPSNRIRPRVIFTMAQEVVDELKRVTIADDVSMSEFVERIVRKALGMGPK